jgi:hypothetical protein
VIDGAERGGDPLALEGREVALLDAGILAGDQRHGRVRAELRRVAAVVAERDEVHAAQHGPDHRHADLHDLALAGLQGIERVDAGRIGSRDGDVQALLLEEAALQCDRQADLIDAGHHAGLELCQRLRLRRPWRRKEHPKHQNPS